jgi:hypothetical protein
VLGLSLAEEDKGKVRERCKVTGGADRALLGDRRVNTVIQQVDQVLNRPEANPGISL